MTASPSRVLIIDDDPGRQSLLPQGNTTFSVFTPFEVEADDLDGIDLVCVDEYLGAEWTVAVSDQRPTLMNGDGLAVAAALRSRARLADRSGQPGFAVALFTAELGKLAQGIPRSRQEALTASLHDLEWVFRFEDGPAPFGDRVVELAQAVRSVGSTNVTERGDEWLGLTAQPWADLARAQVDDCRPPQHQLADSTGGRSYLRWLAQRILPYPTFLLDDVYAANMLGLDEESFLSPPTQKYLTSVGAQYDGPLKEKFLGRRWWRASLQHLMDHAGTSQWDTSLEKASALSSAVETHLDSVGADNPVITYDAAGNVVSVDADAGDCVRIQFDGWPVYADEAWTEIDRARSEPELRALVAHDDVPRLDS